jgi:hypothetical protein
MEIPWRWLCSSKPSFSPDFEKFPRTLVRWRVKSPVNLLHIEFHLGFFILAVDVSI